MAASLFLFSGLSSESSVPEGSFANASFVGANTVNGPAPDNVSASPAAFTAETSVENSGFEAATSTIVFGAGAVVAGAVGSALAALLFPLLDEQAPNRSAADNTAASATVVGVFGMRIMMDSSGLCGRMPVYGPRSGTGSN